MADQELLATAWMHGHCRARGFTFAETDIPSCNGSSLWNQAMDEAAALQAVSAELTPEMRRLIVAARVFVFTDQGPEALRELDEASEAFANKVPWDEEPKTAEPTDTSTPPASASPEVKS